MSVVSREKLCFVQFLHPGKEHFPDGDGFKRWNRSAHKRKFLRCTGRRAGKDIEEALHFWAEWEPESKVLAQIAEPLRHWPAFVYSPYYVPAHSYVGLQNTDPFVFGTNFFYTGCQQYTVNGPTQLRFLERGSVILFGSCLDQNSFALDTVFVVDKWIDHTASNFNVLLQSSVPREYREVTLLPWYHKKCGSCGNDENQSCEAYGPERSWRLYFGATPDNPVERMFSFFPCQPAQLCPRGFARPKIAVPDVITDNLYQGKKLNVGLDFQQVQELFSCVREKVESAGLSLGVHAELPKRQNGCS